LHVTDSVIYLQFDLEFKIVFATKTVAHAEQIGTIYGRAISNYKLKRTDGQTDRRSAVHNEAMRGSARRPTMKP